ncbi:MAG: hypothetical protein GMKNLPBB_02771 [Myxococcota bacterium]|nr:hypothetical protein [Myxococcota bacterium]
MPQRVDYFAAQMHVTMDDYASVNAFRRKILAIFELADHQRTRGRHGELLYPALLVFPEYTGVFLSLLGVARQWKNASRLPDKIRVVLQAGGPRLLRAFAVKPSHPSALWMRSRAPEMLAVYQETFGAMSQRFQMFCVAGTIAVPADAINDAGLPTGRMEGRLRMISQVFGPDGGVQRTVSKINPSSPLEKHLGAQPESKDKLWALNAPVGRLAVLSGMDICDAPPRGAPPGFIRLREHLQALNVTVAAHPIASHDPWDMPVPGGAPSITRRQEWRDQYLPALMKAAPWLRVGVAAFLNGQIFGRRYDGQSCIWHRNEQSELTGVAHARRFDLSPGAEEVVHATVSPDFPAGTA